MSKGMLTVIAGRAVWGKIRKRRAGIRQGCVVEKVWKNIAGNQKYMLSIDKFGGYKTG